MSAPLVRMEGITKRFGAVVALDGADFELLPGEIHALLGENGAGKTTLMNVLSGLYRPDAGRIFVAGQPVRIRGPRDAVRLGIGMVHQHFELVGHFTALENIVLGREGGAVLAPRRLRAEVEALMERFGLAVPLDREVRTLPVGTQQKVEILKALYRGAQVLILDEPTTLLTPQEVDALFGTLRRLVASGLGVVFITHKLQEVLRTSDRITVMRRGRRVATVRREEASPEELVVWMVGSRPPDLVRRERAGSGEVVLALRGLTVRDERGVVVLRDCSLEVRGGEILGIAGVAGNGQRELAAAVVGALRPDSGDIVLDGSPITHLGIADRLARGVFLIPEDRLREGILPRLSVAENLVLGMHRLLFPSGRYQTRVARAVAEQAIETFRIVCPGPAAPAGTLSGGNLQKLIAARVFAQAERTKARLLVALNPTRGLDVPSTAFVHQELAAFCARGGGVLLISEDLDELFKLADRIAVLYRGTVAGMFSREAFDPYVIGRLMMGGKEAS